MVTSIDLICQRVTRHYPGSPRVRVFGKVMFVQICGIMTFEGLGGSIDMRDCMGGKAKRLHWCN